MKKLLFPTAIALLLVLTSCEIYVERITTSGDGEEESTSSSSRRTNTASSGEEETGDEITADEVEEFLNAIDEEEALAWFESLSTYEVYWNDGESSIFYQVDRDPGDLYMFNEQKGSDYHLYNLIYDVFHGELTEYHTYTFNVLSLDEDSYTDVYTEEQVANTFASFEEEIIESYRYYTFFAYALPFDFGLLPDVGYSFEEENLKIAAEFEGLSIEEEIYSGTFEVVINPYGYFLEGFSYIEAEDGTTYQTEAYFVPNAEFERHTAAEVYAMAKGETEDGEEETIEEEIEEEDARDFLGDIDEAEAEAWFEGVSTYEFYIGDGETHTLYQIDGSVEDDLYVYIEAEILSTSDTGTQAIPTETFYEADGEGGYSAYLLLASLGSWTVATKVTDLSAEEMESFLAGLKATVSGLYDYDSFAESYLPFSWDELEDVTYSLAGENLKIRAEFEEMEVAGAEEEYTYTGYQEVLVNPYGYVLDATIDITSVGESGYYRRAYFTPEAEFERYSTDNLIIS